MLWFLPLLACTEPSMEGRLEAAASATPEDPCEQAWSEMETLGRGLERDVPGAAQLPEQEGFLEACALLPDDMQPCMSLSWTTSHTDECRVGLSRLPDDVQARVMRAMSGDAAAVVSDPAP